MLAHGCAGPLFYMRQWRNRQTHPPQKRHPFAGSIPAWRTSLGTAHKRTGSCNPSRTVNAGECRCGRVVIGGIYIISIYRPAGTCPLWTRVLSVWPVNIPPTCYAAWLAAESRTAQRRARCLGAAPPFFFLSITPFGVTEPARKRRRPKGSTAG